jgi:hypothetical protein
MTPPPRERGLVKIRPGGNWARLGAERWEVEWFVLTKAARRRRAESPDTYEHDHDRDEMALFKTFKTQAEAQAFARAVVHRDETMSGYATVTRQVVELCGPDDLTAEWTAAGEPEHVE